MRAKLLGTSGLYRKQGATYVGRDILNTATAGSQENKIIITPRYEGSILEVTYRNRISHLSSSLFSLAMAQAKRLNNNSFKISVEESIVIDPIRHKCGQQTCEMLFDANADLQNIKITVEYEGKIIPYMNLTEFEIKKTVGMTETNSPSFFRKNPYSVMLNLIKASVVCGEKILAGSVCIEKRGIGMKIETTGMIVRIEEDNGSIVITNRKNFSNFAASNPELLLSLDLALQALNVASPTEDMTVKATINGQEYRGNEAIVILDREIFIDGVAQNTNPMTLGR